MRKALLTAASFFAVTLAGCEDHLKAPAPPNAPADISQAVSQPASSPPAPKILTVQDAKEFIERAEKQLLAAKEYRNKAAWVKANFITSDTSWIAQKADTEHAKLISGLAAQARGFEELTLPDDMVRKLDMMKRLNKFPPPQTQGAAEELAALKTKLSNRYSQGRFDIDDKTYTLRDASRLLATSRNPDELAAVWEGWRRISADMRGSYARLTELTNQGANELGYDDTGELWRSGYDMSAGEFISEANRLWVQVKPLYDELHCYVRAELNQQYGDDIVPLDRPIRGDLLGNMWGQSWGNIYDIVALDKAETAHDDEALTDKTARTNEKANKDLDLTALLRGNAYDTTKMVKTAEGFFTSLGLAPLPESFWARSLFVKPRDRDVTCHASAWNIDEADDLRIKMCSDVTAIDFKVMHHELGHSFYQRAYKNQSIIYRDGAHDGFHEAVGDMVALSVTPDYYARIGLVEKEVLPDDSDLSALMRRALDRVAFLPFGMVVDQWRWKVFSGEYAPSQYNQGWWDLRSKYQGIRPPVLRSEADFDPGSKFHIASNVPYMRYFLSSILQYQFHQAACKLAEHEGPLHTCSIYGNKEVGRRLNAMLQAGASKPWADTLEAFTGSRHMDGQAMLAYYAPLMKRLKAENTSNSCGW